MSCLPCIIIGNAACAASTIHSGDDIKTGRENLGHHTAAILFDRFGHGSDPMRLDRADRMQAFIQAIPLPEG